MPAREGKRKIAKAEVDVDNKLEDTPEPPTKKTKAPVKKKAASKITAVDKGTKPKGKDKVNQDPKVAEKKEEAKTKPVAKKGRKDKVAMKEHGDELEEKQSNKRERRARQPFDYSKESKNERNTLKPKKEPKAKGLVVMERTTMEQRVLIVKTYYQNGESYAETVRKLRGIHGQKNAPNESTVRRLIKKFEATGSTANIKTPERFRSSLTLQNIAIVRDSLIESPTKSIRCRSQELGITRSSLQRILVKISACEQNPLEQSQPELTSEVI